MLNSYFLTKLLLSTRVKNFEQKKNGRKCSTQTQLQKKRFSSKFLCVRKYIVGKKFLMKVPKFNSCAIFLWNQREFQKMCTTYLPNATTGFKGARSFKTEMLPRFYNWVRKIPKIFIFEFLIEFYAGNWFRDISLAELLDL